VVCPDLKGGLLGDDVLCGCIETLIDEKGGIIQKMNVFNLTFIQCILHGMNQCDGIIGK
jgi:hypothetical protein